MGNGPIEGAINSILQHEKDYSKMHRLFNLIFAQNVMLLSLNIITLIPLRSSTSDHKKVRFLLVII